MEGDKMTPEEVSKQISSMNRMCIDFYENDEGVAINVGAGIKHRDFVACGELIFDSMLKRCTKLRVDVALIMYIRDYVQKYGEEQYAALINKVADMLDNPLFLDNDED